MNARTRVAIGVCLLVSASAAFARIERAFAATPKYSVATWNIRSGDGRCPIGTACPFTDATQNCTDTTKPRNAWAYGVPQAQLRAVAADPTVVAIGLQEAWNCGSVGAVQAAIGWPYATATYNGTAIVARYGISGSPQAKLLSRPGDDLGYVVGADVCVDAACTATIRFYATHFVSFLTAEADIDDALMAQAQAVVNWINTQPHADKHVLAGDFNAYEREIEVSFPCERTFDYRAPAYLRSTGYVDAWMALHGTTPGMTATINRNGCGTPNGATWKRIDYGYLKGLTPVSSTLFGVVPVNTPAPSDHYGVVTGFTGVADPVIGPPASGQTLVTLPAGEILVRAADDSRPKIFGRWSFMVDPAANGALAWDNPDQGDAKIDVAMANPTNYFEVGITAAAATPYHVWLRMKAQGNKYTNDSIWMQFSDAIHPDGSPAYRIGSSNAMKVVLEEGSGAGVDGWGWADNGYGSLGTEIAFARTGTHVLRIQQREDGAAIDQILLSPSAYLRASPGLTKRDTRLFRPTQLPQ